VPPGSGAALGSEESGEAPGTPPDGVLPGDATQGAQEAPEHRGVPEARSGISAAAAGALTDGEILRLLEQRLGPIIFDRLRVTFGEDVTDLPLGTIEQAIEAGGADMTETLASEPAVDASPPVPSDGAWEGVLVVEGSPTGDGRQFSEGALTWAELPLPLKWQEREADGHDGAVIVGRTNTPAFSLRWHTDNELRGRTFARTLH